MRKEDACLKYLGSYQSYILLRLELYDEKVKLKSM